MLALFDLDGTLADRHAGQLAWAVEFAADHGLDPAEVDWLMAADGNGMVSKEEYFGLVRERYGLAASFDELWVQYRDRQPTLVPAYDGMLDGLKQLRAAGWRIGVVTNGYEDVQTLTLTSSGIAEHVDGWAISAAENIRKPDVGLFEIAAARAGSALGGGWMVGDSQADIVGGRAAGLRTAWVHHGREWPAGVGGPDHVVAAAADAVRLILR
ncbi:HAD family hydrolase [Kutzneria sp. 744]|uniref:HAD family hydrolase n=1 Tax=Kutzneria sp. (strain 744) TaxID=345341 RepID=UPI0003EEC9E4|nr:HAD family hydrolase [Kutzneria sp. 744]EWM19567.1 phosphatase [Kutzneria sp. 744]